MRLYPTDIQTDRKTDNVEQWKNKRMAGWIVLVDRQSDSIDMQAGRQTERHEFRLIQRLKGRHPIIREQKVATVAASIRITVTPSSNNSRQQNEHKLAQSEEVKNLVSVLLSLSNQSLSLFLSLNL